MKYKKKVDWWVMKNENQTSIQGIIKRIYDPSVRRG